MEVETMLLPHMSPAEVDLGIKVLATLEGVAPREAWFWELLLPPPPNCCMIWLASFSVVMLAWMVVLPKRQLFKAFWALVASRPEAYITRAIPLFKNKWKFFRGPC